MILLVAGLTVHLLKFILISMFFFHNFSKNMLCIYQGLCLHVTLTDTFQSFQRGTIIPVIMNLAKLYNSRFA